MMSQEITQEKLYHVFMYNFLCQNDKIFERVLNYIRSLCGKMFQYY